MTKMHQICLKIRKKVNFEKTVKNISFRRLVWKDKLNISKLQIIFYKKKIVVEKKNWAQTDKKYNFFLKITIF